MPLLGTLLVALFGGVASWFAQFFARKVAIAATYVTVLATIYVALLVVMRGVLGPLAAELFSYQWAGWMGLAFPPVAGTCMSALAVTWAGCVLYRWQLEGLKLAATA